MLRRIVPLIFGLALVSGARLALREPPAAPEPTDEAPALAARMVAPVRSAPATPVDTDPAACAELQAAVLDRLDAVQAEVERFEVLRTLLTGEPIPWPEDAPQHVREEAVRVAFRAAAAAVGDQVVLREVRCEEYPCVGIFEKLEDETAPSRTSGQYATSLHRALEELDGPEPMTVLPLASWRGGADGNHHVAIALAAGDVGQDVTSRLRHRWLDAAAETGAW